MIADEIMIVECMSHTKEVNNIFGQLYIVIHEMCIRIQGVTGIYQMNKCNVGKKSLWTLHMKMFVHSFRLRQTNSVSILRKTIMKSNQFRSMYRILFLFAIPSFSINDIEPCRCGGNANRIISSKLTPSFKPS